jgi:hypothetical protein
VQRCLRINEPPGQAKVDEIDTGGIFTDAKQKVVGFDVAVNELLLVNMLQGIKLREINK